MLRRRRPALNSISARADQSPTWIVQATKAGQPDSVTERLRGIHDFLLKGTILVQRLVRGRVGLHVLHISAGLRHTEQPVCQPTPQRLRTDAIAVRHEPKYLPARCR